MCFEMGHSEDCLCNGDDDNFNIEYKTAFHVYLNNEEIDTVFYSKGFFKGYTLKEACDNVKKLLVEHDGYDSNIIVR